MGPPSGLQEVHRAILSRYDIGPVRSFRTLAGGMFLRPLLVITDSGKYVLRGHGFRATEESFRFQAESIAHARRAGIPCPEVIRDRAGSYGQCSGELFWALHEYAEGNVYSWQDWRLVMGDPAFVETLGFQVARLHDALRSADPGGDSYLPITLPPIQFDHLPALHAQWRQDLAGRITYPTITASRSRKAFLEAGPELECYWTRLAEAVKEHGFHDLPHQIVHGDLSPVNMLFPPESRNFSLIDWDCVHVGLRIYDALGDVLNRPPVELAEVCEFDALTVGRYLKGYQRGTRTPLSPRELRCVPTLCLARQFEDLRQRLQALPNLPAEQDVVYASLIRGRVRMMRQILSRDTFEFEDMGGDIRNGNH